MSVFTCASRRVFLRCLSLAAIGAFLMPATAVYAAEAPQKQQAAKKNLVVYFSRSGHTRKIAEMIHNKVGGDIIEIKTAETYPDEYNELTKYAKAEKERGARPKITTRIANPDQYGVVFLGYPNWWSTMPMPVFTFVEQNRLDGKTIAPFTTHGGGGIADSVNDLKKIAPHAKVLKPLAVNGNWVDKAEKDVVKWLEGLGPALIDTTTGNPAIYPDGGY